jgi:hypothetical protein
MNTDELIGRTLLLDIETTKNGQIRHVGAVFNHQVFENKGRLHSKAILNQLDDLADNADFVLGHNLLGLIFNNSSDRGLSADSIAEGLFPDKAQLQQLETATGLKPSQIVIKALHDMAEARLLDRGLMLSAILRPKGKNSAMKVLKSVTELEQHLLSLMQTKDPDADSGNWVELNIRRLSQKLKNEGFETSPHVIRSLIKGLSYDGKGLAATMGSLELRHISRDRYTVRLQRHWDMIKKTVTLRHNVAHAILLILAGPGSGKTTVIVHRCAYLLQVERIPARQILVLCFNHYAAVSLRKRLNKLVGKQARGVTVVTYHGAAMRIAGISVRDITGAENTDEAKSFYQRTKRGQHFFKRKPRKYR